MYWEPFESILANYAARGIISGYRSYYEATRSLVKETGRSLESCQSKVRRLIKEKRLNYTK